MNDIRIGIVGVGIIGKFHMNEYRRIPGAKVIAIADKNEEEARRVAEEHRVPHVYTDFRELLSRGDIDAIDVCLHNNLHAPVTIAALEAGKHVYCEKPIAGSYADGVDMLAAAERTGRKLHIHISNLYHKEVKAAKTVIENDGLGKPYHARSVGYRRRGRPFVDGYATPQFVQKEIAGGGALFDMGVYHIAEILYLLNTPQVERISGKIYQEIAMDEKRRKESGYNVEELGLGFVKFSEGLTLDIFEAWAVHMDKLDGSMIFGTEGGIRLRPFSYHTTQWDLELDATANLDAMAYRHDALSDDPDAYRSSQHHWIAALQGRTELLPTAHIALQTILIQEGIYLSDRLGREVTAQEVIDMSKHTRLPI